MGWPQIVMIIAMAFNLCMNMIKHGEDRDEKYNFWVSLISCALQCVILFAGGFFG